VEELIGPRLRQLRKRRGVTLETLAAGTGLTKGYLSKIETGKMVPPIATLSRIAQAIGCDMAYFFQSQQGADAFDDRVSVVRADEQRPAVRGGSSFGYDYRNIAHTLRSKAMDSFIFTFPAELQGDTFFEHQGEELVFVLNGTVVFEIAGRELTLEAGDSVYFDSSLPHRGKSKGAQAQALVIIHRQPGGPHG
jgi:transcriptional regulator with XRE-family HTH domain